MRLPVLSEAYRAYHVNIQFVQTKSVSVCLCVSWHDTESITRSTGGAAVSGSVLAGRKYLTVLPYDVFAL